MVQRLICCLSVICLFVTAAIGADKPSDVIPQSLPLGLRATHFGATPVSQQVESGVSPVDHLRRAANHLDAAAVGELQNDLSDEARKLRQLADEIEEEAEGRLNDLRDQLQSIQQEIRKLEELTHSSDQVHVDLRIIEVDVTKARQLGLKLEFLPHPVADSNGESIELASATSGSRVLFGVDRSEDLKSWINRLVDKEVASILAEPRLVTTSGRPATLNSGGEFPVLVPQSTGQVSIEWRDFGVRAEVLPVILDDGRLRLDVAPEISERDFSNSVNVQGMVIPGITKRRVNTQVEMSFGQTLVIGGLVLISKGMVQTDNPLSKVPKESRLYKEALQPEANHEKHLIVLVTPSLVHRANGE
ncbi:MAG: hypothetical protein KDA93_08000 [Planctomycetaceae bacterium]|nr:hypothetical protein [Planctomycetaceae bacterium]